MPKLSIKNPGAYVIEAARFYGLDIETVVKEMERGFEDALSYITGYDVEAWMDFYPERLDIRLFGHSRSNIMDYDYRTKEIELDSITANAVKLINSRIRQRIEIKRAYMDFRALVPEVWRTYEGRVTHPPAVSASPVGVELYKEHHGIMETIYASCAPCDQASHERGTYRLGQSRMWMIKSVKINTLDEIRSVRVNLTRNSILFPAVLMRNLCRDAIPANMLGDIKCVERIVGKRTILISPCDVPRKAVARLSEELREKVRIHNSNTYRLEQERKKKQDDRITQEHYPLRQRTAGRQ